MYNFNPYLQHLRSNRSVDLLEKWLCIFEKYRLFLPWYVHVANQIMLKHYLGRNELGAWILSGDVDIAIFEFQGNWTSEIAENAWKHRELGYRGIMWGAFFEIRAAAVDFKSGQRKRRSRLFFYPNDFWWSSKHRVRRIDTDHWYDNSFPSLSNSGDPIWVFHRPSGRYWKTNGISDSC